MYYVIKRLNIIRLNIITLHFYKMKKIFFIVLIFKITTITFGQQVSIKNPKTREVQEYVLIEKDGLFGLISTDGEEIIKPCYDNIHKFGEYKKDWAMVEKEGLFGFITINGFEIIKPFYDNIYKFGEYKKDWAMVEKDGLFGFITVDGVEIVKPKYDAIKEFLSGENK